MFLHNWLNRKPKPSVPHTESTGDNLAADLQALVGEASLSVFKTGGSLKVKDADKLAAAVRSELIAELAIYITRRDHKVFDHAWYLGLERGREEKANA